MTKYLVVSVDLEESQTLWDFVVAETAEAAEEWVSDHREYANHSEAFTIHDLRKCADDLESTSIADIRVGMAELADDQLPEVASHERT